MGKFHRPLFTRVDCDVSVPDVRMQAAQLTPSIGAVGAAERFLAAVSSIVLTKIGFALKLSTANGAHEAALAKGPVVRYSDQLIEREDIATGRPFPYR